MSLRLPVVARCVSLCVALCASPLVAQSAGPNPAESFLKARALYYTPVDNGLRSFHCDVRFDWKAFIQKATNEPVADDNARLQYLRSVQLTVEDDLHGAGALHWTAATPPPEDNEDAIAKVREGLQQIWAGFAQTWNGYVNGELVSLDAKATVEHTAAGYHVAVRDGAKLAEEQYNNDMLLQTVHVSTPAQETTMTPTFTTSQQRLLVTGMRSMVRQPPSAPPSEVVMQVQYAPVGTFQIPSELTVNVGQPASTSIW